MTRRIPLRYQGGKQQAVPHIAPLFPENLEKVFSPFFGGGSVELALARRGVCVNGTDAFAPLVSFWKAALARTTRGRLVHEIRKYVSVMSRELFHKLRRQLPSIEDNFERAVIYFVLNRASVNGRLLGYSYKDNRFTENSIRVLEGLDYPPVSVELADFRNSIPSYDGWWLFGDPPYHLKSGNDQYGYRGELHRDFDHEALAELIKRHTGPWMLCYNNDSPKIRQLYRHFRQLEPPEWFYGSSRKRSRELFIFGDHFPLPHEGNAVSPTSRFQVPVGLSLGRTCALTPGSATQVTRLVPNMSGQLPDSQFE